MKIEQTKLFAAGCLSLILLSACNKHENISSEFDSDFPPNKVGEPVKWGEPNCYYLAKDVNGGTCIVDWNGTLMVEQTAALKREYQATYGGGGYTSNPPSSYTSSSSSETFTPKNYDRPSTSISAGDGWKIAGEVARSPEFWALVGKAIGYASGNESKPVHVDSYTDKHGRYVPEHYRSKPNQ